MIKDGQVIGIKERLANKDSVKFHKVKTKQINNTILRIGCSKENEKKLKKYSKRVYVPRVLFGCFIFFYSYINKIIQIILEITTQI